MKHELARMRRAAMFEEINALPGAERGLAVNDGNGKMGLRQRRANMRRHVVRTFGVVLIDC
jgi:hypothetical protein